MNTKILTAAAAVLLSATPAQANNLGENGAWQFRTGADLANAAAALEVMERKRAGGYSAPSFTTNVARQFNCGVSASALGNSGSQTALANSPTVTGASANSQANASDTAVDGEGAGRSSTAQSNSGAVTSGVNGATHTAINGSSAPQALNSSQSNGGTQSAGVTGSTACTFGVLN